LKGSIYPSLKPNVTTHIAIKYITPVIPEKKYPLP